MSSTNSPFGIAPIQYAFGGGGSQALRTNSAGLASGYASNIYQNSPVKAATDGTIAIVGSTEAFLGAFNGVKYQPLGDRPRITNFWPASQALATSTNAEVYFYDDPLMLYEIQATGTLAQTSIYDQGNFSAPTTGNTTTGYSAAALNSTLSGAGTQGQLRIIGLALEVDNDWGDAFTRVQVQIASHQLTAPQTAV